MPLATGAATLNFVVIGDVRSGTRVLQSSIAGHASAVCHADLLSPVPAVCREAHESYFGQSADPGNWPEWFVEGQTNPRRYLINQVFGHVRGSETAVGMRLLYPMVSRLDLYDFLEESCREGDFCLIHVWRNPVACFASLKQAERTGIWTVGLNEALPAACSPALSLDIDELVSFVRQGAAIAGKVRASCDDVLDVTYHELFADYQNTMERVFGFLELPTVSLATCGIRRLRNRLMRERILNLDVLRRKLPADVRIYLEKDLF